MINYTPRALKDIKAEVLNSDNIVLINGYYRYVDHNHMVMTTGFLTKEKLIEYSNDIRFDNGTMQLMRSNYNQLP
jgi:hypothetical protein